MPAENGYVPTPEPAADYAVHELFEVERPDTPSSPRLLLPGLGTGNLYDAVVRYCTPGEGNRDHRSADYPVPECVGVEQDPSNVGAFEMTHRDHAVDVRQGDFLLDPPEGQFDWVLANPPYTRYSRIPEEKRAAYRDRFETASGKFPLFAPFVEQSIELLKPGGWATFIIPVQALCLDGLSPLQEFLGRWRGGPAYLLPEPTFDRKIQTVVLTVRKKESTAGLEVAFGLDRWYVWECAMERYLGRLGVEDVAAAVEQYETELEAWKAHNRGRKTAAMVARFKELLASEPSRSGSDSGTDSGSGSGAKATLDEFV